ncbi:DUF3613 domain-containing protein [Variovorax sp. OV700]|uniref:DUF3613 domain-containing protein n=1 Tax=Variovorax sp. OV700 TaxID=1882826 RepID=UPI000880D572|nr:DUF3613 domain-containing protein [Variovorax sp. OV700]SDI23800.1 Protein of unknown function [Variovorax sp. OV700]
MNHQPADRIAKLPFHIALAAALFAMVTVAFAQTDAKAATAPVVAPEIAKAAAAEPPTQGAQIAEPEEFDPPTLRVGDATQSLFAWQRSGEIASPTPRPIAGSVASRSYERYIKSFDYPIPERLGSTVTKSNGAAGGAAAGAR